MRRRSPALLVAVLAGVAGVAGCGPGNGLTLGPVQGTITLEGKPIRLGYVTFLPDSTNGPPATGSIREDGTFVISTEQSADGAIVGSHKVAVIALDPNPLAGEDLPKPEDDPEKFLAAKGQRRPARAKKSAGPTYTAHDGKTYRVLVPERLMNPETSGITAQVRRGSNTIKIAINKDGTAEISY